jgi:predicted ester cyclase
MTAETTSPEQREANKRAWEQLQEVLNRGDFGAMDAYFHPEFVYDNPSRPDLTTFEAWKRSPIANYETFAPSRYYVKSMVAEGDEVWAHCRQTGVHSHGNYMGQGPSGKSFDIEWFSIITFKEGKIVRIFSIADVLGKLVQLGVLDRGNLPVDAFGR